MNKELHARIKTYTGTTTEWSNSEVILLKGEIGYETDSGIFKFGNGIDLFKNLPNAKPTKLAELEQDENNRLVNDTKIKFWNNKQDTLIFDNTPTNSSSNILSSGSIKRELDLKANTTQIPSKLSQLTNDINYASKDYVDSKVSSVYKYKGSVANFQSLPNQSLTIGDTYNVVAKYLNHTAGTNYVWNGNAWDALGGEIDLSEYTKTNDLKPIAKTNRLSDATSDATHRLVTDSEKSVWNAKQNKIIFDNAPKANSNNLLSSGVIKANLDTKANISQIPTRLSTLATDSTHRLVTDNEKNVWNNKQARLTFDLTPTQNSTNPVVSGGIKTQLDRKADITQIKHNSTQLDDTNNIARYTDRIVINGGEL